MSRLNTRKKFNLLLIYYITNCTIIKYISHFDIIRVILYVLRNIPLQQNVCGGGKQSILFGRKIFWIIESNSNTTQLIERNKMKIQAENNESSNYEIYHRSISRLQTNRTQILV